MYVESQCTKTHKLISNTSLKKKKKKRSRTKALPSSVQEIGVKDIQNYFFTSNCTVKIKYVFPHESYH